MVVVLCVALHSKLGCLSMRWIGDGTLRKSVICCVCLFVGFTFIHGWMAASCGSAWDQG